MLREFNVLYDSFSRGVASPLPPLPIQYADYSEWQREWLQGEVLERQLDYWRKQLAGHETLNLPTDRQPQPAGTGITDWVFRKYPGVAHPIYGRLFRG
jgi:hypothetical protein